LVNQMQVSFEQECQWGGVEWQEQVQELNFNPNLEDLKHHMRDLKLKILDRRNSAMCFQLQKQNSRIVFSMGLLK
jgi:hypothetical protein